MTELPLFHDLECGFLRYESVETQKVEMSKLHWTELVQYSFLFAAEKDFLTVNNRNDIRNFLERAIDKYETETFKLRKKAFEKETEG